MKILLEGKTGEIVSEIFIENLKGIKENIDKKETFDVIECKIFDFIDERNKNIVSELYSNGYEKVMNDFMPLCFWFHKKNLTSEFVNDIVKEPLQMTNKLLAKFAVQYVLEEVFKRNITIKNIYDFINKYGTDKNWEDFNDKLYNLGINIENI